MRKQAAEVQAEVAEVGEAKHQKEAEHLEARWHEEEEEEKCSAEAAKAAKPKQWWHALLETWATLADEFCARTISKKELRKQSAVIQAETESIQWAKLGQGEDKSDDEGEVKTIEVCKWQVVEDNEDKLKDEDNEVFMKKTKFEEEALLNFKGPVSCTNFQTTSNT